MGASVRLPRILSFGRRWKVSATRFDVTFDGEGLADGTMDVRDLAPALLALGGLIERANLVLNEDRASVSVRVALDKEPGSFPVGVEVVQSLAQQMAAMTGGEALTVDQLLAILGIVVGAVGSGIGLLQLLQALAGSEPKEISDVDGNGNVTVTGGNNTTVVAHQGAVILLQDPTVRKEAEKAITRPLGKNGVSTVRFSSGGDVTHEVGGDDRDFYIAPPATETSGGDVDEGTFIDWVTVNKHWNTPQNKWQFVGTGGLPFNAHITDESFWEDMEKDKYAPTPHARFQVRVEYRSRPGDDQPECTVTDVLDYQPADRVNELDLLDRIVDHHLPTIAAAARAHLAALSTTGETEADTYHVTDVWGALGAAKIPLADAERVVRMLATPSTPETGECDNPCMHCGGSGSCLCPSCTPETEDDTTPEEEDGR
jgi:hypothetical protein